jgi:hypothetical protein
MLTAILALPYTFSTETRAARKHDDRKDGHMRYAIGILFLASPAFAGEPVYTWRSRVDDPDRTYLYLDGQQIGGWCYQGKHYRAFDGKDWGPPTNTAPVKPPANRVIVTPAPMQAPIVVAQQPFPQTKLRGPLRVRAATVMTQTIADTTMRVVEEIPGAILDSILKGRFELKGRIEIK